MRVLVTGGQGFVGAYTCMELLNKGYNVISVDDFSKYGKVKRPQDNHPNFELLTIDLTRRQSINELGVMCGKVDYIIAGAAIIGGIALFHKRAYDLLAANERIIANTFDYALNQYKQGNLKKIIVLSSSMVFETTTNYPTKEEDICPPPSSTYGFQKLAVEYFCKGAHEQYGLPYTIVRPFNCVGVGEDEALGEEETTVGNIKMMMSHVVPDLVHRAIVGGPNKPLTILGTGDQIRHYTNGRDLAKGIVTCMEHPKTLNNDFNISSPVSTTVKELAHVIWNELYPGKELVLEHAPAYTYDVQNRVPSVTKAKSLLGIECNTPLVDTIREVIDYMRKSGENSN